MTVHSGCDIVNSGLVLAIDGASNKCYPGSGTAVADLSGNGINGTLTNGTGHSTTSNGYFTFDASDDYINMSSSSIIDDLDTFTISVWVKTGTGSTERGLVAKGPTNEFTGVTADGWSLRIRQGVPGFSLRKADGSGYADIFSGTNVENDTWCMITGRFDSSTVLSRYFNDSLEQQTTMGQSYRKNTHTLKIGILDNKPTDGEIASVLLYNRALSTEEITQNYLAYKSRFGL